MKKFMKFGGALLLALAAVISPISATEEYYVDYTEYNKLVDAGNAAVAEAKAATAVAWTEYEAAYDLYVEVFELGEANIAKAAEDLKIVIDAYNASVEALEQAWVDYYAAIDALETANTALEDAKQDVLDAEEDLVNAEEDLVTTTEEQNNIIEEQEEIIENAQGWIDRKEEIVEAAQEKVDAANAVQEESQAAYDAQKEITDAANTVLEDAQSWAEEKAIDLEKEIAKQQPIIDDATQQISDMNTTIADAEAEKDDINDAIVLLKEDIKVQDEILNTAQEAIAKKQSYVDTWQARLDAILDGSDTSNTYTEAQCKTEVERLTADVNTEIAKQQSTIDNATNEIDRLNQEVAEKTAEIKELDAVISSAYAKIAILKNTVSQAEGWVTRKQEIKADADTAVINALNTHNEENDKLIVLEAELDAANNELEKANDWLAEKEFELQKELDIQEPIIAEANGKIEDAEQAIADAEQAVEDAKQAVTDAQVAVVAAQTAVTDGEAAVDASSKAITDAQTAVWSLYGAVYYYGGIYDTVVAYEDAVAEAAWKKAEALYDVYTEKYKALVVANDYLLGLDAGADKAEILEDKEDVSGKSESFQKGYNEGYDAILIVYTKADVQVPEKSPSIAGSTTASTATTSTTQSPATGDTTSVNGLIALLGISLVSAFVVVKRTKFDY